MICSKIVFIEYLQRIVLKLSLLKSFIVIIPVAATLIIAYSPDGLPVDKFIAILRLFWWQCEIVDTSFHRVRRCQSLYFCFL